MNLKLKLEIDFPLVFEKKHNIFFLRSFYMTAHVFQRKASAIIRFFSRLHPFYPHMHIKNEVVFYCENEFINSAKQKSLRIIQLFDQNLPRRLVVVGSILLSSADRFPGGSMGIQVSLNVDNGEIRFPPFAYQLYLGENNLSVELYFSALPQLFFDQYSHLLKSTIIPSEKVINYLKSLGQQSFSIQFIIRPL